MSTAESPQDQVIELGRQWAKAELQGDVAALGSQLAADFVCVGPLGFVLNKAQYLASRQSGNLKQQAFAWEDVQVRIYGDTAVAIGTQTQTATFQGRDASGRFRVTQVLVRAAGRDDWAIASLHLSPIAPPAASPAGMNAAR